MDCFLHPGSAAVAQCNTCSKGLCRACASRFAPILCEECLVSHNRQVARGAWTGLTITVVVALAGTAWFASRHLPIGQCVLMGVVLSGTYWGWKFLSERFPHLAAGSFAAWGVYLVLKFVAAFFIGLLVGPYQIFRTVRELRRISATSAALAAAPVAPAPE